jgi:hypothetical protein
MRLVLFSLGAFVLIALVAIIHDTYMRPHGPEFIVISIQDEATGERNETLSGMGTDQMGKCFYGPVSWKSKMKLEEVDCWVKEPPTDPDHPRPFRHQGSRRHDRDRSNPPSLGHYSKPALGQTGHEAVVETGRSL